MPNPDPIYLAGPVATIDEAIERMDAIDTYIDVSEPRKGNDGVACFNHLYGVITRRVRDGVNAGFFQDSEFLTVLDVAFANRYLDALRASVQNPPKTPKVWKILIERRNDERLEALQFAVAGVNAHINYDLSASMFQTCITLDRKPDTGTQHADYQKINDIFADEMRSLRQYYQNEDAKALDSRLSPVLDLVGNFAVEQARDAAWEVSEQLWMLRSFGIGTGGYLKRLDGLAALAGNILLTPVI